MTKVYYTSAGRQLLAWLITPKGAGPHRAVLFAHGGFALSDGECALSNRSWMRAIRLLPSWRGENGNPGNFEMYYGEVDDAQAALEYLARVPGVDTLHLYAAGQSAGGTIVMLLAEVTPLMRKAAACGGCRDMRAYMDTSKRAASPWDDAL